MPELPIRFIGHPMIDVGVATLCAAANVNNPRDLTPEAIDAFTSEIVALYLNPAMAGFLTYVVFAGARFANPAQLKPAYEPKRRAVLSEIVNLWKPDAPPSTFEAPAEPGEACVFSGDAAKVRVSRMYVPMTTDEDSINFVPEGVPLMPVSGWCLLALLVMPLGGLASKGKMWIVHSFNSRATLYFAKRNLERNRQDFQMEHLKKWPNYKFSRTYLLRDLAEAQGFDTVGSYPLTAYLFTSSGRKSEIEITHLPSTVVRFIRLARREAPDAWKRIVERAERLNSTPEDKDGQIIYHTRNYFYEDLFDLPTNAHRFLRQYILRTPIAGKPKGDSKNDPRYGYSLVKETELVSWTLTEIFLKEVLQMDTDRIAAIKTVADRLADYIRTRDERLFKTLFNARNEYSFRLELIKAARNAQPPLFSLDEFVQAFFTTTEADTLRSDWLLARDLMIIRIIEKLYESGQVEIIQKTAVEEEVSPEAAVE